MWAFLVIHLSDKRTDAIYRCPHSHINRLLSAYATYYSVYHMILNAERRPTETLSCRHCLSFREVTAQCFREVPASLLPIPAHTRRGLCYRRGVCALRQKEQAPPNATKAPAEMKTLNSTVRLSSCRLAPNSASAKNL